jgi:hypothetical protein
MNNRRQICEVKDWVQNTKCVPTALAAIAGRPISEVIKAINAETEGRSFTQFEEIPPELWLKALERLGLKAHVDKAHEGMTIDEFMATSYSPDPILVFAKDETLNMTHVFAVQGNNFVDCYTDGKIAEFKETPSDMKNFKLKGEIIFE